MSWLLQPDELLRMVERSIVWHAVGDLLGGFDPLWLAVGLVGLLVLGFVSHGLARSRNATWGAPAAPQRSIATVRCACGRSWTVRT
jgi:hypothetical protein